MRPDAEQFADELLYDHAEPGGKADAITWAYDPTTESVYLDSTGLDAVAFSTDSLREIADGAEAEFNDAENDSDTDDEPNQWDSENDILLQNMSNTVGLAETSDALKPLSADAQSVLVTPGLLREALDVADGIGENAAVWITSENERPVVMTPKGDIDRLSAVLTPRITMGDTIPPTEDL